MITNQVLSICILFIFSFFDIRYKKIPYLLWGCSMILTIGYILIAVKPAGFIYYAGLIPGMCMLLISFASNQSVGYGDGLTILMLGLLVGFKLCVGILCLSLFLISIYSIVLLIIKKANRKTTIPYIPFLLAAGGIILWSELI